MDYSVKQWGMIRFDGNITQTTTSLPISISMAFVITTFSYGAGVHSTFGGWRENSILHLYRKAFMGENVDCIWFCITK